MTDAERSAFERRRERALAGLGGAIDVLSAWRGRYEDDDRPAGIDFITRVIPEIESDPQSGWLCVRDTKTPGIGWRINERGQFVLSSLCRSLRGIPWPVTRGQFREAARKSEVVLPAIHATAGLDVDAEEAAFFESLKARHERAIEATQRAG